MKVSIILAFTLLNSFTFAASEKKAAEKSGVQGDIVVSNTLQKMLDIQGVKPIYETCKKDYPDALTNPDKAEQLPQCIWEGVKKNSDLKKQVMQIYADTNKSENTNGRSPASSKTNMVTSTKSVTTDYSSDPSVKALSDFYGKKLDEILNPNAGLTEEERKKNIILTVDHRKFIDLYKSELGKTIISAFTSYCLDTYAQSCSDGLCLIKKNERDMNDDRKTNIESLKNINLDLNASHATKWNNCIFSVTKVCDGPQPSSSSADPDDFKYSQQRACLIVDYVKVARKNIQVADTQKDFYDKLAKEGTVRIDSNMKIIEDGEKASSDSILKITKKDIQDSLKDPMQENLSEMDACYDAKTDTIKNVEACKQFLSTNKNANEAALAELGMRQIAQEEMLTEELQSDDKVREYLKEEGYKDEDIQKMTASKDSIEDIRQQILNRFKNEKEAIIKEMAAKIQDKTSTEEGKIDAKDISKLSKIREDLSQRSTDLSSLMQFSNIVSSYLQTNNEATKEKSRNTASLFAEANSMDGDDKKALQEQIKKAGLKENKDKKDSTSSVNLEVGELNKSFIKYDTKDP